MHFWCLGGAQSPAPPTLTDVPVAWKKPLLRKVLSEAGTSAPQACDALVSPLGPG